MIHRTMKKFNIPDSFQTLTKLDSGKAEIIYFRINKLEEMGLGNIQCLPYSIKILLESVLRSENNREITKENIVALAKYNPERPRAVQIPFKPARVLLQDFTGVPCVVDLAAMRSAMHRLGKDPKNINPEIPVDLVIDHSLQVDCSSGPDALKENIRLEFERNRERYEFLNWGQKAFDNFRVIPPSRGICHQINLEYLANVVQQKSVNHTDIWFPDSLVGTDSHTTMINGLGVAGWGVGGIEAEAVMLGQPLYMLAPAVVGCKLSGRLPAGVTATDLVLTVTERLRKKGVVGKFVEFYGNGLDSLDLPDRATVANMAPEYGATMGFFPVDDKTLDFLKNTGRSAEQIDQIRQYCRAQGIFRSPDSQDPLFADTVCLDLATVRPSLAGHNRPQDRIDLDRMRTVFRNKLTTPAADRGMGVSPDDKNRQVDIHLANCPPAKIGHGSVIIAAITSCTNTSNPSVMLSAGLLARNALKKGLKARPWVKTSLTPGSTVVTQYLKKTELLDPLEKIGFTLVGYGCATCIGNSGPVSPEIEKAIQDNGIVAAGVVSGNRNFEGRIHPCVQASYLASPPLVVAYALAGTVNIDLSRDPLALSADNQPVYLKDIWPSNEAVKHLMQNTFSPDMYISEYKNIESSSPEWNRIPVTKSAVYEWRNDSTYIQEPAFFKSMENRTGTDLSVREARVLLKLGDSITTDHISPAGTIPKNGPAAGYLNDKGIRAQDFNSFGSRRGNHHVMTRGTFANIRLQNRLTPEKKGGWTRYFPTNEIMTVYDAAVLYQKKNIPLIVLAGRDYGMGSSRDWAAKGTFLLGVRAVIAASFERIHRSNLVGMGVLPLQFQEGQNADSLDLSGTETFNLNLETPLRPGMEIAVDAVTEKHKKRFAVTCRLDSPIEVKYYCNGGILQTVLKNFITKEDRN